MINLPYSHESVRLTGRWDRGADCATATATGSYVEFAFRGRLALARFDVLTNASPRIHVWIQLDGGDMIEAPIDSHLRVCAKEAGEHVCRIIYKGGTEVDRRWYAPLTGKISFRGVQVEEAGVLPADNRKTIEFVGDSITEGVLIDADFNSAGDPMPTYMDMMQRCYLDDVCATYAWLTAEALDLRPIFMGYGAVGVAKSGCGAVPEAAKAYPFNFDGSPISHKSADYIMINHGANDAGKTPEVYIEKYYELLDVIRSMNPNSEIIALSAFCGAHRYELRDAIAAYNEKNGCNVHFINGGEWIPKDPLHPLRDGHITVASHLVPLLRELGL